MHDSDSFLNDFFESIFFNSNNSYSYFSFLSRIIYENGLMNRRLMKVESTLDTYIPFLIDNLIKCTTNYSDTYTI